MMESRIDTIIFDIDGTLVDSYQRSSYVLQQALKNILHKEYSLAELDFHFGIPLEDTFNILKIDVNDRQKVATKMFELYCQSAIDAKLFDGVTETINILVDKKKLLGIVTSQKRDEYNKKNLLQYSISNCFKLVVYANDTSRHKPNPDPINKFLEISKCDKNKTIYIGDTIYDCLCAHRAGIKFALACWGARHHVPEADYFLQTPQDILNII